MAEKIDTAAVLGAGVMGSAIAAHLAGAGIKVHLLDIVPPDLSPEQKDDPKARNALAERGLQGALKAKPAAFYDPSAARLVHPGNFEDHMTRLAECDLVVEAVVERMDIKKPLLANVAEHLSDDAILASNTSGLSIAEMSTALPESVAKRFLVMHFFNPVRYMRLLEIVPGPSTEPAVVARAARIGELLGKGIVYGKDTTNFVANRIGVHGMLLAIDVMQQEGLSIEEVDKIAGKPMARPKSAIFRTADVVGIDTLVHVAQNCYDSLTDDEERDVFKVPEFVRKLVEHGATGQKAGAGFYKKEGKNIRVLDLDTLEYRDQKKVEHDSLSATKGIEDAGERLKTLVYGDDAAARFAWKVTAQSLSYTARRVGEIADDIVNIDRAMRWGFNWEMGPFEMWDAIGVADSVARMDKEGFDVPDWVRQMLEKGRTSFYAGGPENQTYFDVEAGAAAPVPRDPHAVQLPAIKADANRIVKRNGSASLLDLGDGCLGLEVHTKMNTLDADVVEMLQAGVDEAERNFEALVIGNDGGNFGAGANLYMVLVPARQGDWGQIERFVKGLQSTLQNVRHARVPVVAAPYQLTLGGCAEMAMAADACQAQAETYMGLVEAGVGLIPAGGGCLRMVERWTGAVQDIDGVDMLAVLGQASLNLAMAKVATGAEDAKRHRYLLPSDGISLNPDHLLYHAKQRALGMARAGYLPPRPRTFRAAGLDAAKTIGMRAWSLVEGGHASEHDALVAKHIGHILCGGTSAAGAELSEQDILDLECEAFLSLCGEEKTQERIEHTLKTGKPLRN